MIKVKDFEDKDGKIDWNAYRKAQLDNGERCERCDTFIVIGKGYRQTCSACKELSETSMEVTHKCYIRCPKCGHIENVHNIDCHDVFNEGEHCVCCAECDYEYTVSTYVAVDFTSPPRVPKEEEVEEKDDDDVDD